MQVVRWIIAAAIFVALLFLSLQNAETVTLKFFNLATWQAPLVFIVFVAFAVGVAVGLLAGALRTSRLKRQLSRLRREQRHSVHSGTLPSDTSKRPVTASGPRYPGADHLVDGL
jgi:lipopolysaccharide assembly protein A